MISHFGMLTVTLLGFLNGDLSGQPKTTSPPQTRLEEVLDAWDKARRASKEFQEEFTSTSTDSFQDPPTRVVVHGKMFIQKPNRVRVEMKDSKGNPSLIAVCIEDKCQIYLFDQKTELAFTFPSGFRLPESAETWVSRKGGFVESMKETILWTLFGPPIRNLGERYKVHLDKEDENWVYIRLEPKKWSFLIFESSKPTWKVIFNKKEGWLRRLYVGEISPTQLDFFPPMPGRLPPQVWDPPFKELPPGWKRNELKMPGS